MNSPVGDMGKILAKSKIAKVVIVEDEATIVRLFTKILTKSGLNVTNSFCDGKDFIDFIESIEPSEYDVLMPDVVILDWRMKILDGLETAKLLRIGYPKIKIVMISAYELPAEGKGYFDAKLTKPVSINRLLDTVSSVLGE